MPKFLRIPLLSVLFVPSVILASTSSPTLAELQAQIQSLIVQIQALQALRTGTTNSSSSTSVTPVSSFTSNMSVGSSGSQVVALQQFLVSNGYLVLPKGVAYGYYGTLTASAVSKFQGVNGISKTGSVGPLTRAKINSIRVTIPVSGPVSKINLPSTGGGGGTSGGNTGAPSSPSSPTNPTTPTSPVSPTNPVTNPALPSPPTSPAPPSGFPSPDIYSFGFEDGTAGAFKTTSLGNPISAGWVNDTTNSAGRGSHSLSNTYPASTGNVAGAGAIVYPLPQTRTSLYTRILYKQSPPFNNNGTYNNADQVKLIRYLGPGLNNQYVSFLIGHSPNNGPSAVPLFVWDHWLAGVGDRGANLGNYDFNAHIGQWISIEMFADWTNPSAARFELWIDGTKYFDYTDNVTSSNAQVSNGGYQAGQVIGFVQFDGTVNSMKQQSTAWFDEIGLSSQQMGVPSGSPSNPNPVTPPAPPVNPPVTPPSDTTPPPTPGTPTILSSSQSGNNIVFNLSWSPSIDQPSNTEVPNYSYGAGYNDGTHSTNGTTTTHTLNLTLPLSSSATTGFVCVRAVDAAGNRSLNQACNSLTIPALIVAPPSDTTPPTVSITSPSSGTISGTVTVSATASDNVGVSGVQFRLDGGNLQAEDTSAPYSISLDTTTLSNGAHILSAVARDAAGNQTTASSVNITVSNSVVVTPPPVQLPPSNGFATPDILNDASFESSWNGFTDWGASNPPSVTFPRTLGFDSTQAAPGGGTRSVKTSLPDTSSPSGDLGGQLMYPISNLGFGSFQHLWTRFYFKLDAPFNGILKFNIWFDSGLNTQFSGLYLNGGFLQWFFTDNAASGQSAELKPISSINDGNWHCMEYDYWRVGDPSGFPTAGFWLDNTPITTSPIHYTGPLAWVNGRLNAGQRGNDSGASHLATGLLGKVEWDGVENGATAGSPNLPHNTVPTNLWIDRISISSQGRIGCN